MSGPIQVTIASRLGGHREISVDWYSTDTVYDVLERAGINPQSRLRSYGRLALYPRV